MFSFTTTLRQSKEALNNTRLIFMDNSIINNYTVKYHLELDARQHGLQDSSRPHRRSRRFVGTAQAPIVFLQAYCIMIAYHFYSLHRQLPSNLSMARFSLFLERSHLMLSNFLATFQPPSDLAFKT